MHAVFVLSVSCQINQIFECLVNLSRSFMVRSQPGPPTTIIAKSSLLSCWHVKHPLINCTPPIPLHLVKVVMLIDDRLPRSFENENEGGAESDWLSWEPCIPWFDSPLPETRLNERTTRSWVWLTQRTVHDSIHCYRKLDWTNERWFANDSSWRTESRKRITKSNPTAYFVGGRAFANGTELFPAENGKRHTCQPALSRVKL